MPLDFPPGSAFKYNNGGYVILGHVIERLTRQSYEAYVRENILDPLGLQNTGYEHVEAIISRTRAGLSLEEWQDRERRISRDERARMRLVQSIRRSTIS